MKNRMFYLGLNFLSILTLIFIYKKVPKEKKRFLVPLYLAYTGLNYIFEFFVLVVTRAYEYKPNIFKNKYFDNVFGSSASQLFIVPSTSLLYAILDLKARWAWFFTSFLVLVERWFMKEKVYKHYWWSTPYTFIGIRSFYAIAKFWKRKVVVDKTELVEMFTLFFSIFVCYATMNFFHVAILKTCMFNIHLYENHYRTHVFFSTIYSAFCAIFFVLSVVKKKWSITTTTILSFLSLETLFIRLNLITISNPYLFYSVSIATKVSSIWIGHYVNNQLEKETNSKEKVESPPEHVSIKA
ncbi:hypothetical protein [Alkalihalobacterium bogoriense]|uniref:hypothetical protein n=1 Tax=Alkalihalobacterium bogoriense TaxID=246272 RepID=UPI00047DE9DC|nr:hypothetical protein [Alkalihalobacterium bogoriense]